MIPHLADPPCVKKKYHARAAECWRCSNDRKFWAEAREKALATGKLRPEDVAPSLRVKLDRRMTVC